jgi:hypothetical protein
VPCLQHRPDVVEPRHQDRPAGVQHHHDSWVGGRDGRDQPVLIPRQGEGGAVHPLAQGVAGEHHRDVAAAGQVRGLLDPRVRWLPAQLDVPAADPELREGGQAVVLE